MPAIWIIKLTKLTHNYRTIQTSYDFIFLTLLFPQEIAPLVSNGHVIGDVT